MPVYVGQLLSGSTNGLPIPVVAIVTPGTTLHTAAAMGYEEVYIWAANVTSSLTTLTLEWGGVTDPGDHLVNAYTIPANSLPIPIALGQRIDGSVIIRAFAGTASAINITGFVNQVQ